MRIWSIHPRYLDAKGLVALWRETLLAQAVLNNATRGYRSHPQLIRFRAHPIPLSAIGSYLLTVHHEARERNYNFDRSKIVQKRASQRKILVTSGQLEYEFFHLKRKLKQRDPERFRRLQAVDKIEPHPLFKEVPGNVEPWELVR